MAHPAPPGAASIWHYTIHGTYRWGLDSALLFTGLEGENVVEGEGGWKGVCLYLFF